MLRALLAYLDKGGRIAIVQAPPGSGKTAMLVDAIGHCVKRKLRVAVGTQTNSQADDVCRRIPASKGLSLIRFASPAYDASAIPATATLLTSANDVPVGPCVVVGTIAKWGFADVTDPFDVLFVDEAWQMPWAAFMLCGMVAERFVLIGDPGQIPPVVTIDTSRWETAAWPPHRPAPELILRAPPPGLLRLDLPGSRRLPSDTVDVVRGFYDFNFDAWAQPGQRRLEIASTATKKAKRLFGRLHDCSVLGVTIPTPEHRPPLELDHDLGRLAAETVTSLLKSESQCRRDDETVRARSFSLAPGDIGIAATHRVMNNCIRESLPSRLRGDVRVDTPERWQGLERPVMIVVHPLSGVVAPSGFDLETGRLCVMASRHMISLIVLARDHVGDTLESFIPSGQHALGTADVTGMGHARHLSFWSYLRENDRILAV